MTARVEMTRGEIVAAAARVFAAQGYACGSVRDIARAAQVNVAAISYHFGGKAGLYAEVLRRALDAFASPALAPAALAAATPEAAVRAFVDAQFDALETQSAAADYVRIFAWESVMRSDVLAELAEREPLPSVEAARAVLRHFIPTAPKSATVIALVWLLNQTGPFLRDRERLARAPLHLAQDDAFAATLREMLATLILGGLRALGASERLASP